MAAVTRAGRGPGRRGETARDRRAREEAAVPAAGPGLARHSLKIVAVVALAVLGLVFFPRLVNRQERRAAAGSLGSADAGVESASVGGGRAAGGSALAATGGPGMTSVEVSTIPHGGKITLDSTPLAESRLVLSLSDPKAHDIVAEAGCRRAVAQMTAADVASFKGNLVMELKPRQEEVMIASEPPGARIRLNGHDSGKETPAVLAIDGCENRTLELSRDGYRPWRATYTSEDRFDVMVDAVKKIRLEPVPVGEVRVRKPADYDLEIYAGEKRIGRTGETLTLPEGKHALTFRNDKLFVKETAQVSVEGGKTATPVINFPVLGTLTVQAQPSNCKVFVDGVFVDVTPVLEAPIASGGHRVKVVFVPNGAEQEVAVAVSGGKNSLVTVKF